MFAPWAHVPVHAVVNSVYLSPSVRLQCSSVCAIFIII